jgi:Zn-dependent metalloprotease
MTRAALLGLACLPLAGAARGDDAVARGLAALGRDAGGAVTVRRAERTGTVTFLTAAERPVPVRAADPRQRARAFIDAYAPAFGLHDAGETEAVGAQRDALGRDHVRLRQTHAGVPVTGAELTVHLAEDGVTAVLAKTLPIPEGVGVRPRLRPAAARRAAAGLLRKYGMRDANLGAPRLEILNRGLLDATAQPTRLAWFVEATSPGRRDFVWVDARSGAVWLRFNQRPTALDRAVHDAERSARLPGTLVRREGDPPTGDADADFAYDFSGDTYRYFAGAHGRDSYDGQGTQVRSSVHYCEGNDFFGCGCPCQNAFWDGRQLVFGDGFATDDIVAHEFTHGVTERSANLFYYMQSGALNESYSDIFGETVDLLNGTGNDDPGLRWVIGEDVPGSPFGRHMANPQEFGDPAKLSDSELVCDAPGDDAGGVHSNSGVPNHAYALMVDGGHYNGATVRGIGLAKADAIQYRALTLYLVSASDFADNDRALRQACRDLIGQLEIAPDDCEQVGRALDAVEMAHPWPCGVPPPVPALCPEGRTLVTLFFDDLEAGEGNWLRDTPIGPNRWSLASVFARSGTQHLWGEDLDDLSDSRRQMTNAVTLPAGARLQFNHAYGFEDNEDIAYDGGVIEYRIDNGGWIDAGSLIVAGAPYNGRISDCCLNPLKNKRAFTRDSRGYTASQLDLASLAGRTVSFRFRLGTDSSVGDAGWFIDDVHLYQCIAPPASPTSTPTPTEDLPSTETPPASDTPTITTPTETATATASATPSVTATATPTATATLCPGDCGGDGAVAVDDLVTAVAVALGAESVGACRAVDRDGNGSVTVAELVRAIHTAANGCGASP